MWEVNFGTQGGVDLIESVRLVWGPLNTGFTVFYHNLFLRWLVVVVIRQMGITSREGTFMRSATYTPRYNCWDTFFFHC